MTDASTIRAQTFNADIDKTSETRMNANIVIDSAATLPVQRKKIILNEENKSLSYVCNSKKTFVCISCASNIKYVNYFMFTEKCAFQEKCLKSAYQV